MLFNDKLLSKTLTAISTPMFAYENAVYNLVCEFLLTKFYIKVMTIIIIAIVSTMPGAVLGTFPIWSLILTTTPGTGGNIISLLTGNWGSLRLGAIQKQNWGSVLVPGLPNSKAPKWGEMILKRRHGVSPTAQAAEPRATNPEPGGRISEFCKLAG